MEDYIMIAQSRCTFKTAIKTMHKYIRKVTTYHSHKEKLIGLTNTGCDFLGYTFKLGRKLRDL